MSFPRRQQYQRLRRAGTWGAGSACAFAFATLAVIIGAIQVAAVLVLASAGSALYARHWLSLAGRSRVGARSEDEVQRALASLQAEGWRLRHSLTWAGRGDIDSVAVAPTGIAFTIETKTQNYEVQHLARVRQMAGWLHSRRRSWCRNGVVPVLCVVRARRLERVEGDLLIVSLDRLLPALRSLAETSERPGFLTPGVRRP